MMTDSTDNPERKIDPLLIGRKQAAAALGISPASLDRLRSAGKIGPRPIRLSGRLLWNVAELRAWVAAAKGGKLPDRTEWEATKTRSGPVPMNREDPPPLDPVRGPSDGAPGGGESRYDQWMRLVDEKIATGMTRRKAIQEVVHEYPGLREAFLREYHDHATRSRRAVPHP